MKKIPTMFKRSEETRLVVNSITIGCEWVAKGKGIATRKWDGTCCMVREGELFKRYTLKRGKTAPKDFEATTEPDEVTGKVEGWVHVGDGKEDRWHMEAFKGGRPDGTYELCGPKVQGNPERCPEHVLIPHGYRKLEQTIFSDILPGRDFISLREYLGSHDIEGIVFHHPDGRMAKVKGRDFGITRAANP